jgi:ferric-dicitrate binding protein FerR (iron transport regulator)
MMDHYNPTLLDELLQQLLDGVLSEVGRKELNLILRESKQARIHYRTMMRLHAALIRHPQSEPINTKIVVSRTPWSVKLAIPSLAMAASVMLAWVLFKDSSEPIAKFSGTTGAVWAHGSNPDSQLALGSRFNLTSGFAEVSYSSGVRVILEGPCRFEVTSQSSMEVTHGRATVKVPHHLDGFHLDTPSGRITDLGTEFGVAVGSGVEGAVTLTEVFDGEIEIPAEAAPRTRLHSGDSLAIVRETGGTRLVSTPGDYRVDLGDFARSLPAKASPSPGLGNLALGKPVSSPAHYTKAHGNVFPPEALTDGRINDTGSPGDWSFWLAPNGDSGEFTVDLLQSEEIGRIELQNTRNRTHGDRGLRDFSILGSEDGVTYQEIVQAELPLVSTSIGPGVDFPFESLSFPPIRARFVKIVGLSHYRHPSRPQRNVENGGGLNEIRIFAP